MELARVVVDVWHLSDAVMRTQLPALLQHSADPFGSARAWQSDLVRPTLRLGQLLTGAVTHWEKEEDTHG